MKFHENKLLTAVAAVALTFAVAACSSNGDDDQTASTTTPTDPTIPAPPAPLSELATAQADAAAAALAAMTESDNAAAAATAAMAAVANLATMQTGATAGGLAYEAHTAAGKAMMAYMDAKAASEAAAEAEDVTAAVEARIMAAAAMADAVKYATMASEKGADAETAAMAELMIDGKDKNVGGTSLNADDGAKKLTTDGVSMITGRMEDDDPMHMVIVAVAGPPGMDDDMTEVDESAPTMATPGVAAATLTIGRTLDTTDDMARLMLVTSYAGSKKVNYFVQPSGDQGNEQTGTKVGFISSTNDGAPATTNDIDLKSVGMYYPATDPATGGTGRIVVLIQDGTIAEDAIAEQVYSYVPDVDGAEVVNLVLVSFDDALGETTYTYQPVTLGDLKVNIPEATQYEHIHFGVWAALGAAAKNGTQKLSELGIGFVQNFSGGGLTSIGGTSDDLPNSGDATYNGNWAAAVQAADDEGNGDITLEHDAATLTADFGKGDFTAVLTGLATLTGDIDGNTFSGDEAKLLNDAAETGEAADLLGADGKFTGSFSGGFYGTKAAGSRWCLRLYVGRCGSRCVPWGLWWRYRSKTLTT